MMMRGLDIDLILNFGLHKSKSHFTFGNSICFFLLVWFGSVFVHSLVMLDLFGLDRRLGWVVVGYMVLQFFFAGCFFGFVCLVFSSSSFYVGDCWRTSRGVVGDFFWNVIQSRVHTLCSCSREKKNDSRNKYLKNKHLYTHPR